MSFWDSKLVTDAENGKLPEVPITIENSSIVKLALALVIVGIIIILIHKIFK